MKQKAYAFCTEDSRIRDDIALFVLARQNRDADIFENQIWVFISNQPKQETMTSMYSLEEYRRNIRLFIKFNWVLY